MPFLRTESPTTAHVFRYAGWMRAMCWVGVVFFLALAAAVLLSPRALFVSRYIDAGAAAFLLALAAASCRGLVAARDVVVLYEEGVVRRGRSGREQAARWPQVAAVRSRDVLRRLELLNANGERLLALEYDLDGFERLERIVLERTAVFRAVPVGDEFAVALRERLEEPFAAVVLLLGCWLSWLQGGHPGVTLGFGGMAGLAGVFWTRRFARLHLGEDGLVLSAPLRRVAVLWRDVAAVRIQATSHGLRVRVERTDAPPLDLPRTAADTVAVHAALQAAWRACRGPAGVAPEEFVGAAEQALGESERSWPKLTFLLLVIALVPGFAGWLRWRTLALHLHAFTAPRDSAGWLGLAIFALLLAATAVLARRQRTVHGRELGTNTLLGWCALVAGSFLLGQVYRGSGDPTLLVLSLPLLLAGPRLFAPPRSDDPARVQAAARELADEVAGVLTAPPEVEP